MPALGITATRDCDEFANAFGVISLELSGYDRYVTGGARGGDNWLGFLLWSRYPDAQHDIVLPANRAQVHDWWTGAQEQAADPRLRKNISVFEMPAGTSYKDRNQRIVDFSNELFYVARYPEWDFKSRSGDGRSIRSGTWQTVRLARAAGKPVAGITLSELE